MTALGIDPDTKGHAYAFANDTGILTVGTVARTNRIGRHHERFEVESIALIRRAVELGAVCYLEDIYLSGRDGGSVRTFKELASVQGEFLLLARINRLPVVRVHAATWHSQVLYLGSRIGRTALRNASKTHAARHWTKADLSDHEADAVNIALYGVAEEAKKRVLPPIPPLLHHNAPPQPKRTSQ